MAYKPKTAEQIFLANVLIRVVENHLLRRKVRGIIQSKAEPFHSMLVGGRALERLDDRIALLTRQYNQHKLEGTPNV